MESLTIVIPTNNRPTFLRRSVAFWSKQNFKVIICDGSEESQEQWVRDNSADNIQYYYSRTSFPQRIKMAADKINTRYCMLLSDDEYYLPSALLESVKFLDRNEEFIAVGGVAIGFCPGKTGIMGFEHCPEWVGRERIESSPSERVLGHMSAYTNYLSGSVTRTHAWKSIAGLYASRELPIFALWELEMNLILSYCGKSKVLNNLMHFRSSGEGVPIRNNIPSLSLKNNLCDISRSKKYDALREEFVLAVASICDDCLVEQSTHECSKQALERAIVAYCHGVETRDLRTRFAVFLKTVIPTSLKDRLRFLLGIWKLSSPRKASYRPHLSIEHQIKKLELSGVIVDYNDVDLILSSINEFHGYC